MENFILDLVSYIKKTTYYEERATYSHWHKKKRCTYDLKSKNTPKKQIISLCNKNKYCSMCI